MPLSGRCERHGIHSTPRLAGGRVIVLAMLALALVPAIARADGDPASDVLASQPLVLAADANVPAIEQAQLAALLARARARGFDLRVAVIASPSDLGSITELWRAPQSYARFLGQELALVGHGPLLVVMPNGFGSYGGAASVSGLSPPGRALGPGAIAAVQRLAAASGHPLGAVSVTAS